MKQTPAHHGFNPDLLSVMPGAHRVVEVGCSTGVLAKAYRELHGGGQYVGIEIDPAYGREALQWCDQVLIGDAIALFCDPSYASILRADCYVFGDSLEHLVDPWAMLNRVHELSAPGSAVCACIPNAQHWSLQASLCVGELNYEDTGLLDRTHLRWFTRKTMLRLFRECGFQVELMHPRIFPHPAMERVLAQIRVLAQMLGQDGDVAVQDAAPLQYVLRARRF